MAEEVMTRQELKELLEKNKAKGTPEGDKNALEIQSYLDNSGQDLPLPPVGGGGKGKPPPPLLDRIKKQATDFAGDLSGAGAQLGSGAIDGLQSLGDIAAFGGETIGRPIQWAVEGAMGKEATRGFPEYGKVSTATDPYLYNRKPTNGLDNLADTIGNFAGGAVIPAARPISFAAKAGGARAGAKSAGGIATKDVAIPAGAFEYVNRSTDSDILAGGSALGANVAAHLVPFLRGGKPKTYNTPHLDEAEAALAIRDAGVDIKAGDAISEGGVRAKQGLGEDGTKEQNRQFVSAMMRQMGSGELKPTPKAMKDIATKATDRMDESLTNNGADINVKINNAMIKKVKSLVKAYKTASAGQALPASASRVVGKLNPSTPKPITAPKEPVDADALASRMVEKLEEMIDNSVHKATGGDEGKYMRGGDILEGSTPVGDDVVENWRTGQLDLKQPDTPRAKPRAPTNARTINNWRISLNDASIGGSKHATELIHALRNDVLDDILLNTQGVNFPKLQKSRELYANYKAMGDAVLKSPNLHNLPTAATIAKAFQDQATDTKFLHGELTDMGQLAVHGGNTLRGVSDPAKIVDNIASRSLQYGALGTVAGGGGTSFLGAHPTLATAAAAGAGIAAYGIPRGMRKLHNTPFGDRLLSAGKKPIPTSTSVFGTGATAGADKKRHPFDRN